MPRVTKSVIQRYFPSDQVVTLQEEFKGMVNEIIRRGLQSKITSKFKLRRLVYNDMRTNGFHTHFILTAVEKATSILKNYRREQRKKHHHRSEENQVPYVMRKFVTIDNQSYKIKNGTLRFAIRPRQFVGITLNSHTLETLYSRLDRRLGSITLTNNAISISYSREVEESSPFWVHWNRQEFGQFHNSFKRRLLQEV
jgi:predicted transposase